jgi:hypothetical protein
MDCTVRSNWLAYTGVYLLDPYLPGGQVLEKPLMTEPIFTEVKATHDLYRATARIQARMELAAELRQIPKPTKQVVDLIKKLEANA